MNLSRVPPITIDRLAKAIGSLKRNNAELRTLFLLLKKDAPDVVNRLNYYENEDAVLKTKLDMMGAGGDGARANAGISFAVSD